MNGPSAIAARQGGQGGALKYRSGHQIVVEFNDGGGSQAWKKKTSLQAAFGDFGQVLQISTQEDRRTAIIEFEDPRDAADAAETMDGKRICGCTASVKLMKYAGKDGGGRSIDDRVSDIVQKHGLDATSAARLVSAFKDRSRQGCDLNLDFQQLSDHLAASNKPSALVCMKLAELREGKPIGPCRYRGFNPAQHTDRGVIDHGTRETQQRDRQALQRSLEETQHRNGQTSQYEERQADAGRNRTEHRKSASRSRDRHTERNRSRNRHRQRSRSREKDKSCERDRHRDRHADRETSRTREKRKEKDRCGRSRSRSEGTARQKRSRSRGRKR